MPIFNSIHELLRRIGVASNDVPDVGLFHEAFGGRWQHVCHVDFPFQKDIELVFKMNKATPEIPKTMTGNVAWIQDHLPEMEIVIPTAKILEFKEALIFDLLGVLKLRNEINVLSSVTGAKRDHSSGEIY
jgi:hypothetical protein